MCKQLPSLLAATILSLGALYGCQPKQDQNDMMQLTEFATRYAAAWSGQDPRAFASFYAENGSLRVNDGDPSVGRDAVEATARAFMTAFPDMAVRLVELRKTDDHVEFHWHWTGTNTGPGGTGNPVDLRGYEVWTLDADGLILESDGHYDEAEYRRQLNAGMTDLVCSRPDNSAEIGRFGDRAILQGRLYLDGERYEFRPCGKPETYLLMATLEFEDVLSQYTANWTDAGSVPKYVRFNGYEMACKGVLPDRYAGVVKATDHQVSRSTIPTNCD